MSFDFFRHTRNYLLARLAPRQSGDDAMLILMLMMMVMIMVMMMVMVMVMVMVMMMMVQTAQPVL